MKVRKPTWRDRRYYKMQKQIIQYYYMLYYRKEVLKKPLTMYEYKKSALVLINKDIYYDDKNNSLYKSLQSLKHILDHEIKTFFISKNEHTTL